MNLKLVILISVLLTFCAGQLIGQNTDSNFFDNRSAVEEWIQQNKVPALGIGIIRDGKLREVRMYGEISKGNPAPYNAIFNVASLTKPVVAILTMKLVSNGAWSLDEPLANYWVDPDIAGDPRHKKLTTRLVLSHQTGFKNWRYQNKDQKLSFDVDPGTKFGYSGEGFEYLRKSLEKKFKKPLDKMVDSILFMPLGMQDTRFKWDKSIDESRFAHWFDEAGNEHKQDYKKTSANAADDLLTTIEDYGKFATYVMNGAGLDSSVFNEMVRPQVPTKKRVFMSLGWELFQNLGPQKEYAIIHSGSDQGVKTLVIILPVSKQGLLIFMNGDNGYKLYDKLITELLFVGKEMMEQTK